MKLSGKLISLGVAAGAMGLAAAKLVDIAYNKIGGKYITFTGRDYNIIPDDYEADEEKEQEL